MKALKVIFWVVMTYLAIVCTIARFKYPDRTEMRHFMNVPKYIFWQFE